MKYLLLAIAVPDCFEMEGETMQINVKGMPQGKYNKGCITCAYCRVIRNHYFCGNTRLSEKQVFNSKGFCSNFKNKNSKGGKENG